MNEERVPTYSANPWSDQRIRSILSNEKYMGACLTQKTYIDERGIQVSNNGQLAKYYAENHHPAIVSQEDWKMAQRRREERKPNRYPFSGRLHCPRCGAALIRKSSRWGVDWVCGAYLRNGKSACSGIFLPEDILTQIVQPAMLEGGRWTVKEDAHGSNNKREKSYSLVPTDEWDGDK